MRNVLTQARIWIASGGDLAVRDSGDKQAKAKLCRLEIEEVKRVA